MSQPLQALILSTALFTSLLASLGTHAAEPETVARGRYLVAIGGCNDCHTPGFAQQGDKIPETERLTGAALGFSGPWGVSYPNNLRLTAARLSEGEWLSHARRDGLPPMPWSAMQAMTRDDLLAIYRYLRALGPAGVPAPVALAPGQPIPTPHFVFVPQPPTTTDKTSSR